MPPGSLRHKLIVGGERSRAGEDEVADATKALREMISAGHLSKMMPVKLGAEIVTRLIEQEGPIAFVESTTLGEVFSEDESRALPLYTDETLNQTGLIIASVARDAAGQGPSAAERELVQDIHHTAQRMLQRCDVLIPFAPQIGKKLSSKRIEVRRAFPAVLSMVQASALLHQNQRQQTEDGHLIADRKDYEIAQTLLGAAMKRQIGGGISEPAERFWRRLAEVFEKSDIWTVEEASKKTNFKKPTLRAWITELRDAGLLTVIVASHGRKPAEYQLSSSCPDQAAATVLPDAAAVFG
jgi:hypothetical protein